MLKLTEKEIDISDSSVLFSKPFTQKSFESYWEIASGRWHVEKGWLTGLLRENAGGMLFTKVGFPGNILLDFHARTVPPCDKEEQPMQKVRWGVIGAGGIADRRTIPGMLLSNNTELVVYSN